MTDRRELFSSADERDFKRQWIVAFLASYEVENYQDNCHRGWPKDRRMPVEDAAFLADQAWRDWVEIIGITE